MELKSMCLDGLYQLVDMRQPQPQGNELRTNIDQVFDTEDSAVDIVTIQCRLNRILRNRLQAGGLFQPFIQPLERRPIVGLFGIDQRPRPGNVKTRVGFLRQSYRLVVVCRGVPPPFFGFHQLTQDQMHRDY